MSVAKVAEAYKLPMSKGEIDYNACRSVGYTPTEEELSYVMRDTEIVARAFQSPAVHASSSPSGSERASSSLEKEE